MKPNKMFAAGVIAAGILSPLSAMAGPILTGTQAQTFSFSTLNDTTTFSFSGFNSAGILNSVHFEWTLNKTISNTLSNQTTSPQLITNLVTTSTTTFTGSGIAALLTGTSASSSTAFTGIIAAGNLFTFPAGPPFFGITTIVPTTTIVGITTVNNTGGVCLSNDNSCGVGNINLSSYIGGANLFNIAIANIGSLTGIVPPNVFSSNSGTTDGTVSLFYDYTVPANIPEPASLSLMGLGLAYLSATRRKKAHAFLA